MDEETKAHRIIIEDPLINGYSGIQVSFLILKWSILPQNTSPKSFKRKYQENTCTQKFTCIESEGGILFLLI